MPSSARCGGVHQPPGQRQRKPAQNVSQTSPDWKFPQGHRVSVPDRREGQPTIPRRRQEVCACADRPAEAFFLFGPCTARFSFGKTKREMGGASAQPSAWLSFPRPMGRTPRMAGCRPYGITGVPASIFPMVQPSPQPLAALQNVGIHGLLVDLRENPILH